MQAHVKKQYELRLSLPDLPALNTRSLIALLLLSTALLIQNTQSVRVSSLLLTETPHPTKQTDNFSNWDAITQMSTSTNTMFQSSALSSTSYGGSSSTTILPRVTPVAPPNGTATTFKQQLVPGGINDRWWIIDYWSNLQATFPAYAVQFTAVSNTIGNWATGEAILVLPINIAYGTSTSNCVWFQFSIQFNYQPGPYSPVQWNIQDNTCSPWSPDITDIDPHVPYVIGDTYTAYITPTTATQVSFGIIDNTSGLSWTKDYAVPSTSIVYATSTFSPASAVEGVPYRSSPSYSNVPYFPFIVQQGYAAYSHYTTASSGFTVPKTVTTYKAQTDTTGIWTWAMEGTPAVTSTDKTRYYQGGTIHYAGSGFTPNGAVHPCLTTDTTHVTCLTNQPNADSSGNVAGSYGIDVNWPVGSQQFWLYDVASSTNSAAITLPIIPLVITTTQSTTTTSTSTSSTTTSSTSSFRTTTTTTTTSTSTRLTGVTCVISTTSTTSTSIIPLIATSTTSTTSTRTTTTSTTGTYLTTTYSTSTSTSVTVTTTTTSACTLSVTSTSTSTTLTSSTLLGHLVVPIQLEAGWNLISLPVVPLSTSISYLLKSQIAAQDVSIVWSYTGTPRSWQSYTPDKGGTLTTMVDGNAYWVYMTRNDTLYVDGTVIPPGSAPPMYSLVQGWNLVGFKPEPAVQNETVGAYLSSVTGSYNVNNVWVYDNSSQSWIRADSSYMVQPGQGMWILMTASATLRP